MKVSTVEKWSAIGAAFFAGIFVAVLLIGIFT
jgi:hypothetical protein